MAIIDILIIGAAIIAIIYGFSKGFITQLGSLLGIITGVIACRVFATPLAGMIAANDATDTERFVISIISFVVVFFLTYILVKILARLIKSIAHKMHISIIDRIAGAALTLFEWMLFASILLNVWQAFTPNRSIASHGRVANGALVEDVLRFGPTVFGSKVVTSMFDAFDSAGNSSSHQKAADFEA